MGLYDTVRGEYRCDECRKIISVEEQTKDFERLLKDYYPGDYLDDLKANFYYHFSSRCPYCGFDHDICIAVRSGQYLLLLYDYEAEKIDIMDFENFKIEGSRPTGLVPLKKRNMKKS